MRFGKPGSWLDGADLAGDAKPSDADEGCGCRQPLVWDAKRGYWRHLDDGTACLPVTPQDGP